MRSGRNLLYRPTCRRCDLNGGGGGGGGVSCRIVRSRGVMSPKGGTWNRGAPRRGNVADSAKSGRRGPRGRNRERRGC